MCSSDLRLGRGDRLGGERRDMVQTEGREYETMWKGPYEHMVTKQSQVAREVDIIIDCYVPCAVVALLDISSSSAMFPRKWTKR